MIGPPAVRRSALHHVHVAHGARMVSEAGWEQPSAYAKPDGEAQVVREAVGLVDRSPVGKIAVKGAQVDALLRAIGHDASPAPLHAERFSGEGRLVCRLTDDEALILTVPAERDTLRETLEQQLESTTGCVHVLDVTSGLAAITLAGPRARDLLRKCTSLDLRELTFPNLACGQAAVARAHCTIVRDDLGDLPAYHLLFSRDYAAFVWEWLVNMGHEFGIIPFGLEALRLLEGTRR